MRLLLIIQCSGLCGVMTMIALLVILYNGLCGVVNVITPHHTMEWFVWGCECDYSSSYNGMVCVGL